MNIENLYIQKYGGTSVGDTTKIMNVAKRIKTYTDKGSKVVVVVSAMGDTTDDLISLAHQIDTSPTKREMDMLLSTGEQISIALLAIALQKINVPAISFTGGQVKIITDGSFSNARIEHIHTERLEEALKEGKVCIVAGFQGVDLEDNITTLGRGGSDTSAAAIAAALQSKECEIFTDVEGVYTADPRYVPTAKKIKEISYDEMLELASLGAGVLHSRSVEFAKKYGVTLHVRSTFSDKEGTLVIAEEKIMEKLLVTGVTLKDTESRFSVSDIPDRPGMAAELFNLLSKHKIIVDMIIQATGKDSKNTISFTAAETTTATTEKIIQELLQTWGSGSYSVDSSVAIVSAVGVGMKSHVGVAAKMFNVLAENKINIEMISTSEIRISCVVRKDKGKEAVRLIHDAFFNT